MTFFIVYVVLSGGLIAWLLFLCSRTWPERMARLQESARQERMEMQDTILSLARKPETVVTKHALRGPEGDVTYEETGDYFESPGVDVEEDEGAPVA